MLGRTLLGAAVLLALGIGSSFAADLPDTTDNMVILAQDRVTLYAYAKLNSGQIAVNNPGGIVKVYLGVRAFQDTEVISDKVTVRAPDSRKPKLFDVFTNHFRGGNHAIVSDAVSPLSVSLPHYSFPPLPVFTPGTDPCPDGTGKQGNCVVRRKDGPVTLPPGNYGRISVWGGGVLYLNGAYNIKSLHAGPWSSIIASGPATINVRKGVSIDWFSNFQPVGGVNPRCVVLNVGGHHVQIAAASIVSAVINAPNAAVSLGLNTNGLGAIYVGNLAAKRVTVGLSSALQAADPLCQSCEDGGGPCTSTPTPTPTPTPPV